jgi:hypothetical protein
MNRKMGVGFIGMLTLALLSGALTIPAIGDNTQLGTTLFADDFESYSVGTFPSRGGWEQVWRGTGENHITDAYSLSPTRCLQLWGRANNSSVAQRTFSTDATVIGYEYAIRIESIGTGGPGRTESPGFFNRDVYTWGRYYATVGFNHDTRKIEADDGSILGEWEPGVWYRVKVVLDRSTNTYSVWIDRELRAEGLDTKFADTQNINALALFSGHPGVTVYYDNVKVTAPRRYRYNIAFHRQLDYFLDDLTTILVYNSHTFPLEAVKYFVLINPEEEPSGGHTSTSHSLRIPPLSGFSIDVDDIADWPGADELDVGLRFWRVAGYVIIESPKPLQVTAEYFRTERRMANKIVFTWSYGVEELAADATPPDADVPGWLAPGAVNEILWFPTEEEIGSVIDVKQVVAAAVLAQLNDTFSSGMSGMKLPLPDLADIIGIVDTQWVDLGIGVGTSIDIEYIEPEIVEW